MQIAELIEDDGTNGGVGTIETYESDKDVCADMIAKGEENYNLLGTNPTTISVVDGVVAGAGSEEVAPLTYADGKITVNSSENGMLYIFKKDSDGLVSSQKAYSVTANTAASYDFAEDETAYLWNTVLDPICDPFSIAK